jgi:hypothetical protein
MAADPLTTIVQRALSQGWARDELVLVIADDRSDVGARLRESGAHEVSGLVVAVVPRKTFPTAFPDAPGAVLDDVATTPPHGIVHAVQVDEQNKWAIGTLTVGD